jgi:uncharacterized protein
MSNTEKFQEQITQGYTFSGESIVLGCAMLDGQAVPNLQIKVPMKTLNRHGLIAGATGTGKTKTLQALAECLSEASVPVLMMDIKGDLSGIAAQGTANEKILDRYSKIGIEYKPTAFPVELLTLSNEQGVRLRATVSEFGPVLLSKIIGLNDTQGSVLSAIFKYCDDKSMPLLDLKDLKKVIQFVTNEGKKELTEEYGNISTATTGTILRKIVELEQQGAELFFGEKSFEVEDLQRVDENGRGYINIIRLTDIQDRPRLFSTFMLCLMAEIYSTFPEKGDTDAPSLIIFIDEAHLVFEEATKDLLNQMETMVKLIRSKGVGLYFCTQNPTDMPDDILAQLGLKVQHALRAFTAKDRKAIKSASENYPLTDFYKTEDLLTQLGIGEALITCLNEKGIPTPLAHTLVRAPRSRMDILTPAELSNLVTKSGIAAKYNQVIDSESAYEMLTEKIKTFEEEKQQEELKKQQEKAAKAAPVSKRQEKSTLEKAANSTAGRTVLREVTRGILGVFGLGGRSKKKSWF